MVKERGSGLLSAQFPFRAAVGRKLSVDGCRLSISSSVGTSVSVQQGPQCLSSWPRALIQLGSDSPSCAPRWSPATPGGSRARARAGAGPRSGPGAGPGVWHSALGTGLGFQGVTAGKEGGSRQHLEPPSPETLHHSSAFPGNAPSPEIPCSRIPHPFSTPGHFQDPSPGTPSLFPRSSAYRPPAPHSILDFSCILHLHSPPSPEPPVCARPQGPVPPECPR